jgi:hypothetical protein
MMVYLTDVEVAHFSFLPVFCANTKGSSRHPRAKIILVTVFLLGHIPWENEELLFEVKYVIFMLILSLSVK